MISDPVHTMRYGLTGWWDVKIAAWCLGVSLGLWEPGSTAFHRDRMRFQGEDPIGNWLLDMIVEMQGVGILEGNKEGKVRWKEGTGPGEG